MKKVSLEEFKAAMTGEGIWVLADASEPMKEYIKKKFPDPADYDREIKQYVTPEKYIKRGGDIIVVSLTRNIWAGIEQYSINDIIFREKEGNILILKNRDRVKSIITALDYQRKTGKQRKVSEHDGLNIYTEETLFDEPKFKRDILGSGYVTEAEYRKYMENPDIDELTLVQTIKC